MKKLLSLLLALILCLAGCGTEPAAPSYAFDDLSIQIPAEYINLSDAEFAEDLAFVFGLEPITVNGLREPKATFAAYGLEPNLEQYGQALIKANQVNAVLAEKDGICYFTYEADTYTYLVSLWETKDAFWTVQAYCPTAQYSKVHTDMWEILRSVTV